MPRLPKIMRHEYRILGGDHINLYLYAKDMEELKVRIVAGHIENEVTIFAFWYKKAPYRLNKKKQQRDRMICYRGKRIVKNDWPTIADVRQVAIDLFDYDPGEPNLR